MNTASLGEAVRNFIVRMEIAVNRALGRQFIPRSDSVPRRDEQRVQSQVPLLRVYEEVDADGKHEL